MQSGGFEYDIAFSFCVEDEPLAEQLNELLKPRLSTFLYSERQKDLAGHDGQDRFSQVYGKLARTVVILMRPKWGTTKWTRVEQQAIKTRAFDEGFDFTLFVPTEAGATMPPWLPPTRLYAGLERWGVEALAGTLEHRALAAGGVVKQETLADKARRRIEADQFEEQARQFRKSTAGVDSATQAYAAFRERLLLAFEEVKDLGVPVKVTETPDYVIAMRGDGLCVTSRFQVWHSNDLETATFKVGFNAGCPRLPGIMGSMRHRPLHEYSIVHQLFKGEGPGYRIKLDDEGARYTPTSLADHIVGLFVEHEEIARPTSAPA